MSAGPEREKQWRQGWERKFSRAWFPALTNYNMQWVSEWSPICLFPAFPSWSPLPPRFSPTPSPEPRAWKKVLSVSIQVADPGSPVPWPRNRWPESNIFRFFCAWPLQKSQVGKGHIWHMLRLSFQQISRIPRQASNICNQLRDQ